MKNKILIIINFLTIFLLKNNFNFIIINQLAKDLKIQILKYNDYNNKKFIISQTPDKNLKFKSEKFNYLPDEGIHNNSKYNNFFIYNKKFYNNYIFYSHYKIKNLNEDYYGNENKGYCLIEGLSINADLRNQKLGQLSFALLLKEIFKNNKIIFIKLDDATSQGDFYSKFLFKQNENHIKKNANYKVLTREVYEKNKEYFDNLLNSLLLEKNIKI